MESKPLIHLTFTSGNLSVLEENTPGQIEYCFLGVISDSKSYTFPYRVQGRHLQVELSKIQLPILVFPLNELSFIFFSVSLRSFPRFTCITTFGAWFWFPSSVAGPSFSRSSSLALIKSWFISRSFPTLANNRSFSFFWWAFSRS